MDTFEQIAQERRALADRVEGLDIDQQQTQSLCTEWTVHSVMAHLIMPMQVSMARFAMTMLKARGNFDRANIQLTAAQAKRPFGEIVTTLRDNADSRFTPPGAGPEAPLVDILVHGLDIGWPLQLDYRIDPDPASKALNALTKTKPDVVVRPGLLDGLSLAATDIDWTYGQGDSVSGEAAALLLAITGRTAALERIEGPGVATMRQRLS